MADNKNYFLCGGVLFFLLTQVTLPDVSTKEHKEGVADEHSDPILMKDLIYAFCGIESYGTQKDTSDYKECKIEGGKNIPFKDVRLCSGYDQEVRSQYASVLQRMDIFVRRHLDLRAKEWFVKAVLEIIEYDSDILDDEMFYITPNGDALSKKEVLGKSEYDISSFLVGVLHFITWRRRDMNYRGLSTLDAIGKKEYRRPREYNGHLGEENTRKIEVAFLPSRYLTVNNTKPKEHTVPMPDTVMPDRVVDKTDDEVINDAIMSSGRAMIDVLTNVPKPEIDAEGMARAMQPLVAAMEACSPSDEQMGNIASMLATALKAQKHVLANQIRENSRQEETASDSQEPESESAQEHEDKKTTIIHQQTNVVQNGDNNFNLTNNGTMNFNF